MAVGGELYTGASSDETRPLTVMSRDDAEIAVGLLMQDLLRPSDVAASGAASAKPTLPPGKMDAPRDNGILMGGGRSSLDPPAVVPGSPWFRGLLWIPGYKAVFSGSPAVCGPKSAFPGSRFRKGVFSGSPYQKRPSLAPEFQDRTSGVGRTN